MQDTNNWRIGHPEDLREILSKSFPLVTPKDAYAKAEATLKAANSAQYLPEDLQLSISSENVLVVLHAFSKGSIGEKDYALAKQIDTALSMNTVISVKIDKDVKESAQEVAKSADLTP